MAKNFIEIEKNWLKELNAQELANKIKQYWKDKGYDVETWIEAFVGNGKEIERIRGSFSMYSIKSNLINGLPRAYRHA